MGRPGSVGAVEWAPRPQEVAALRFGPGVWQVSSAAGGQRGGETGRERGVSGRKGPGARWPRSLPRVRLGAGPAGDWALPADGDGRVSFEWNVLFP